MRRLEKNPNVMYNKNGILERDEANGEDRRSTR